MERKEIIEELKMFALRNDTTIVEIRNLLSRYIANKNSYKPTKLRDVNPECERVFLKLCEILNVCPESIKTKSRKRELLIQKYAIIFSLHFRDFSLHEIGRILDRDHSTILHSVRVSSQFLEIKTNPEYKIQFIEYFELLNPNFQETILIDEHYRKNRRDLLTGEIDIDTLSDYLKIKSKKLGSRPAEK